MKQCKVWIHTKEHYNVSDFCNEEGDRQPLRSNTGKFLLCSKFYWQTIPRLVFPLNLFCWAAKVQWHQNLLSVLIP